VPVDPVNGPGFHLSVLPLTNGSTAVTLVMSHYLLDGVGGLVAVADAVLGNINDFDYPPPHSRTRLRALLQDSGETVRAAPEVARALVAAVKLARQRRRDAAGSPSASQPVTHGGDDQEGYVVVPGVAIYVDLDHWDARAEQLGGTTTTLATAFTAKLGEHLGRRNAADGTVMVHIIASDRPEGDTRAVAVNFARARIDPTRVTTDLGDARAAIKQALTTLRETPDESSPVAALTPFTPKGLWKQLVDGAIIDPDLPAVYSNLGDAGLIVSRADGTHCEYAWARGIRQKVTRKRLEEIGGHLQVLSCRTPPIGKIYITVVAYRPGGENTKAALRELAARTLTEFGLTGEVE
jgi:hypothetical protein